MSTIFMTIIMLNLLIAIIGDSYEIIKAAEFEVIFIIKLKKLINIYKKKIIKI